MAEEEKEKLVEKTEESEKSEKSESSEKSKDKKKKKKKEEEKTQWWEYVMIIAVLSYKIYTPLPEAVEDRYSRSGKFSDFNKLWRHKIIVWWLYVIIIRDESSLMTKSEYRKTWKVGMFLNKAVYKVGHFIRIVSPATEISYLEAAWSGISMINDRPVEGVIDSMVDLNDYKMHFYTPDQKDCKFVISISDRSYHITKK